MPQFKPPPEVEVQDPYVNDRYPQRMAELETRELENFLAVAEELHFGRAAHRLSIAQPALSRSIKRTEARLGVTLFTRTSRNVALTASGEALLRSGRHALNSVLAAATSARRAGAADDPLRLVIKPGGDANLLSGLIAAYADVAGARPVEIVFGGATDRGDHVRDGRADLALLYVPFDDLTGLDHETLAIEDRVAILPRGHRLARRRELRLSDLVDESLPRWTGSPDDGAGGPVVGDVPQLLEMITLGRAIAMLPRSLATPQRPGLIYLPVIDAPPNRIVLAWSESDTRPSVAAFVSAAMNIHAHAQQ